jgi:hypothetical protein
MNSQRPSCRIVLHGALNERWVDYLGEMLLYLEVEEGQIQTTTLIGQPPDLIALIGMLNAISNLGFTVIAVEYRRATPIETVAGNGAEPTHG